MDVEVQHQLIDNHDGTYDVEYIIMDDADNVQITV